MKIKYHLDIITSKPDKYGNSYAGYAITRNKDGRTVAGQGSMPSNLKSTVRELCGGEWGDFTYSEIEKSIRDFNQWQKGLPYYGCCDDLTEKIKEIFND